MSDIEVGRIKEIVTLHSEIAGHLRMSLEKAIRIGQLLVEQKDTLNHGEFTPWLEKNIPFTDRTARNYMRLFRERDRIKTESVSDLTGAYLLLTEAKPLSGPEKTVHCYANLVNIQRESTDSWAEAFEVVSRETGLPMTYLVQWHRYFFGDVGMPVAAPTEADQEQLVSAFEKIVSDVMARQDEVKQLIEGPSVYICDECVGLCAQIVVEDRSTEKPVVFGEGQVEGGTDHGNDS